MMENKISFNYVIVVFISVLSLTALLIFINNGTINTKRLDKHLDKVTENINLPTTTTTSSNKELINIGGVLTEVNIDTMQSYLGFSIKYDKDNLTYDVLSNSSVLFTDINNKNNYFKIIKLSENDYLSKYELYKNNELHESELESNEYSYSFYRIGSNCFEIIMCNDSNDEFSVYLKELYKYMISTLNEH